MIRQLYRTSYIYTTILRANVGSVLWKSDAETTTNLKLYANLALCIPRFAVAFLEAEDNSFYSVSAFCNCLG